MNWTDCTDDGCQVNIGEKQGSGWYPQVTRRARKPSVAHNHDWRQEMEANPGGNGPPHNLVDEGPEGPIMTVGAGNIVSMTPATTTDGKRWMQATTPDK